MTDGTQVLAISSGFAALHGLVKGLQSSIDRRERISKFVEVAHGDQSAVGYLNSDLELEPFARFENLIGTLLHGPVLAKNVWLADEIIEKFLVAKPELVQTLQLEKFEQVAKFASQASELAKELARE
jgi:hypothetical protein